MPDPYHTDRRPNLWLTFLLFIPTAIAAFILSSRWFAGDPLLEEGAFALAIAALFAIYTSIYGGGQQVVQRQGLLTIFMVASPWLVAAGNFWGKGFTIVWTTNSVLTNLLVALCIGVSEELLFRGILFRAFRGRSPALYVLVTSITFGLAHFNQGYEIAIVAAVLGSSFSLARVAGTSLVPLIVCHAAIDFPNLFPHSQHPQYPLVVQGVCILGFALAVTFLARRTNWTTKIGEPLPDSSTKAPQQSIRAFGGIWVFLALTIFILATFGNDKSDSVHCGIGVFAVAGLIFGVGGLFRRPWAAFGMLILSLLGVVYIFGCAVLLLLWPLLPGSDAIFYPRSILISLIAALMGVPFVVMAKGLRALSRFKGKGICTTPFLPQKSP
jgi:membrane protease YdiL (CAAX protease family)